MIFKNQIQIFKQVFKLTSNFLFFDTFSTSLIFYMYFFFYFQKGTFCFDLSQKTKKNSKDMPAREALFLQVAVIIVGLTGFLWVVKAWSNFKFVEDYVGFLVYCSSFTLFLAIWSFFTAAVSWWLGGYYQHYHQQGEKF